MSTGGKRRDEGIAHKSGQKGWRRMVMVDTAGLILAHDKKKTKIQAIYNMK